MTRLEDSTKIEGIVGALRHEIRHIGRAVSAEQRVYILHSQKCLDSGIDLRECPFSVALDEGIDIGEWHGTTDRAVYLLIDDLVGDLVPEVVGWMLEREEMVTSDAS